MKKLIFLASFLFAQPAAAQFRAIMEGVTASNGAVWISTATGSVNIVTKGSMTVQGTGLRVEGSLTAPTVASSMTVQGAGGIGVSGPIRGVTELAVTKITGTSTPGGIAFSSAVTSASSVTVNAAMAVTGQVNAPTFGSSITIQSSSGLQSIGPIASVSGNDLVLKTQSVNRDIFLQDNGTTIVKITGDGDLTTIGVGGTPLTVISTVSYTPTATNGTNVAASTPLTSRCMRVGNIATCSGRINIDVTSTGAFDLEITVPIASDFTAEQDLLGTAISNEQTVDLAGIRASTSNDRAVIRGNAASTANTSYSWNFQYVVQ